MLVLLGTLLICVHSLYAQELSPCPEIFKYDLPRMSDRWYGTITLQTPEQVAGVWIKIVLDQPVEILKNWFGETISSTNEEFIIRNVDYRIEEGSAIVLRFYVRYKVLTTIPSLKEIRLDNRLICGQKPNQTEPPQTLHLSKLIHGGPNLTSTTLKPVQTPSEIHSAIVVKNDDEPHQNTDNLNARSTSGPITTPESNDRLSTPSPSPTVQVTKNDITCGVVAPEATSQTSFGESTIKGQFPWHVAIYRNEGLEMIYTCGGTLITTFQVLTAAHCVLNRDSGEVLNPNLLTLYLGKYHLRTTSPDTQERIVFSIHVHPEFKTLNTGYINDLAILVLGTPVEYTNYVRPSCLWAENGPLDAEIGKIGTAIGWDLNENMKIFDELTQTKVPIVSPLTCIYSHREFYSRFLTEHTYCADYGNGTMACNGDTGGGLFFPISGMNGSDTMWQIRGVYTMGSPRLNDENGSFKCAAKYAIFTDIAPYLNWLIHTIYFT